MKKKHMDLAGQYARACQDYLDIQTEAWRRVYQALGWSKEAIERTLGRESCRH